MSKPKPTYISARELREGMRILHLPYADVRVLAFLPTGVWITFSLPTGGEQTGFYNLAHRFQLLADFSDTSQGVLF